MGESDRHELGEFLRNRRGRITPAQLGFPAGGNRRVSGLRREEVAIAAGLSPDHYQRIEQGRARASAVALDAIADVLALTLDERHYLHRLGTELAVHPQAGPRETALPPHLLRLIEAGESPSYLLNHRRDVLAWNSAAAALIVDFATVPAENRNIAWLVFTDSRLRSLYRDWQDTARSVVGVLRYAVGNHPHDQGLRHLIERLRVASTDFCRIWDERDVAQKCGGFKRLAHPIVGELDLAHQNFAVNGEPGIEMVVYAPADSYARETLQLLTSWTVPVSEPHESNAQDDSTPQPSTQSR